MIFLLCDANVFLIGYGVVAGFNVETGDFIRPSPWPGSENGPFLRLSDCSGLIGARIFRVLKDLCVVAGGRSVGLFTWTVIPWALFFDAHAFNDSPFVCLVRDTSLHRLMAQLPACRNK
jgi:hypothetical protein